MPKVNLAGLEIRTDESFVYDDGTPRRDAVIFEDYILCHPSLKDRLEEALRVFFHKPLDKGNDS